MPVSTEQIFSEPIRCIHVSPEETIPVRHPCQKRAKGKNPYFTRVNESIEAL
jgi:hypothetical protein